MKEENARFEEPQDELENVEGADVTPTADDSGDAEEIEVIGKVNPLGKKVISETSKEAKEILKKAKKAEKKEPKEPRVTLASKLDEIIHNGGKWETLVAKANAASKELGATTKFNVGTLRAHIKYRVDRNKEYLGNRKVTDEGVGIVVKRKAPKAEEVQE